MNNNDKEIGGKTLKLKDLKSLNLEVPDFTYITSSQIRKIVSPEGAINKLGLPELVSSITKTLKCETYAVRSSALIEDAKDESFAGQFKTIINVKGDSLPSAIKEVIEQAFGFLKGKIEKFSIIIQKYIEPDIAGIAFTRNPSGGREMIIEYSKGRGEEIVGGKLIPKKIELYWPNPLVANEIPNLNEAISNFKKIENFYKFPQDIEWCIKDNIWYFLQTRPITTISQEGYNQSLYLDQVLPKDKKFFFEKTEISEIAPRPTQITKDLLEKIYEKEGPIAQVYKKHKISYESRPILKIIGNELYINREEELKSLLPSYTYISSNEFIPKFKNLSGIFRTIKNGFFLNSISLKLYLELSDKLKIAIEKDKSASSISEFLEIFFKDYQTVFEINLLAGIAINKLDKMLKKEGIDISTVLGFGRQFLLDEKLPNIELNSNDLYGNTLEIADKTKFLKTPLQETESLKLKNWWSALSAIKKQILENPIKYAIIYSSLRELSRWLVVKNINTLRTLLLELAQKNNFKNEKNIYFATLEECISVKLSEKECEKRKSIHSKFSKFNLPKALMYVPQCKKTNAILGISAGTAEGILVSEKDLEKHNNENCILYTKLLSPELTKHFEKIKGIVSEQGGLLSHLAIIAREKGLPAIVNFTIGQNSINLDNKIKIDGAKGEITKL